MAIAITLAAEPRDAQMTPKALRRAKLVPGVMYGHNVPSQSVQFAYPALARVVQRAGSSHLIALSLQGEETPRIVLVREVQRDPVTSRILHIDLYTTIATERVRIEVPLVERGESPAEELGGVVNRTLTVLDVECLPADMPEFIEIDLSRLMTMHAHLTVQDLPIPEGVTVLNPMDAEVVSITPPRVRAIDEGEAAPKVEEETGAEEEESE